MAHRRTWALWVAVAAMALIRATALGQSDGERSVVYVDDSPAAQEMIDRAQAMVAGGRLETAVREFQQVVSQYPYKLEPSGKHLYMDTARWVRRYIRQRPQVLKAYRDSFGATAARQLELATHPFPDARKLAKLVQAYPLTTAGLKAGLDLAAWHLERADGLAAAAVLARFANHPDLAAMAKRYHRLRAVAALLNGRRKTFDAACARLKAMGAKATVAHLQAMAKRAPTNPNQKKVVNTLPPISAYAHPLWSYRFNTHKATEPLTNERGNFPGMFGSRVRRKVQAPVPYGADGELFINCQRFVQAFDSDSGRSLWVYRAKDHISARLIPIFERMGQLGQDERSVAVADDRVFAVVGRAGFWPGRLPNANTSATALVCLDRDTGRLCWRRTPSQVNQNGQTTAFCATPIVYAGRVFVMMAHHQASGFSDDFVVAFDATSGQMLWKRHVATTAAQRFGHLNLPAYMTLSRGDLFVTDGLGVISCISAITGANQWVRVLARSQTDQADRKFFRTVIPQRRFRYAGPPVVVAAGLLIPASPAHEHTLLLNPASGKRVKTLTGFPWDCFHRLVRYGGDVLAIGGKTTLINGKTLAKKWTAALIPHAGNQGYGARGRPAIAANELATATTQGLVVVRLSDGKVMYHPSGQRIGNLLALPHQLVLTTDKGLYSFLSWHDAEADLQRRIHTWPLAVRAPLDLATLALVAKHDKVFINAIHQAMASLDRAAQRLSPKAAADEKQRLFAALSKFAGDHSSANRQLREAVFQRMARLASTREQQVAYHLDVGHFDQDTGQIREAVGQYQTILDQPALASELRQGKAGAQAAGREATRRLNLLIQREGPSIYRVYRKQAQAKLKAMVQDETTSTQQFIQLANEYPSTRAATAAREHAAKQLEDTGRLRSAALQLRWACHEATDTPALARAAGLLAELYLRHHQPERAAQWLVHLQVTHTTLKPLRRGKAMTIGRWLAQIRGKLKAGDDLPTLALPLGNVRRVAGQVMWLRGQQALRRSGAGALLLQDGNRLLFRAGANLALRWTRTAPMQGLQLVDVTPRRLVLFSREKHVLIALDRRTGHAAWRKPMHVDKLLEQVGSAESKATAQFQRQLDQMISPQAPVMQNGQLVSWQNSKPRQYYFVANNMGLCVADRKGQMIFIDPDRGTIQWRLAMHVSRINRMAISDNVLLVVGTSGIDPQTKNASMVAIDPLTGDTRFPAIANSHVAQWIGIGGRGLIFRMTAHRVTAYHWLNGRLAWRREFKDQRAIEGAYAGPEQLAVLDAAGMILSIDPQDGQTLNRVRLHAVPKSHALNGWAQPGQLYLFSPDSAIDLAPNGRLRWRDAISRPDKHLAAQMFSRNHAILINLGAGGRRSAYILNRLDGRIEKQYALPVDRDSLSADRIRMAGQCLVLPGRDSTLLIGSSPRHHAAGSGSAEASAN